MTSPVITVKEVTKQKISDKSGSDQSRVVFISDQDLTLWEARAKGQGLGQGDLVGDSVKRESWDHFNKLGLTWEALTNRRYKWNNINVALPKGDNILLNPDISHSSWSKSYNKEIVYTTDGPIPGATVATFKDADGNGSTYWYCYSDMAPQMSDTYYIVELFAKIESGFFEIAFYTADNSEAGRYWSEYLRVNASDGWQKLTYKVFKTGINNVQDSLSFNLRNVPAETRISLSGPSMTPVGIFDIDDEELSWGDGEYRINVYGKNSANEWTPYQA